jgi:hypothetical protein
MSMQPGMTAVELQPRDNRVRAIGLDRQERLPFSPVRIAEGKKDKAIPLAIGLGRTPLPPGPYRPGLVIDRRMLPSKVLCLPPRVRPQRLRLTDETSQSHSLKPLSLAF